MSFPTTNINETFNVDFTQHPNPASNIVNYRYNTNEPTNCLFSIVDIKGSLIYNKTLHLNKNKKTFSIDVSDFTPGIYYVNITTNDQVSTKKLIIQ